MMFVQILLEILAVLVFAFYFLLLVLGFVTAAYLIWSLLTDGRDAGRGE